MNEQIILLVLLLLTLFATVYLFCWKAKKEIEYKKDERWQTIQLKANRIANLSNSILIVIICIVDIIDLIAGLNLSFTLNRVITFFIIFYGFHNILELLAIKHYDKSL